MSDENMSSNKISPLLKWFALLVIAPIATFLISLYFKCTGDAINLLANSELWASTISVCVGAIIELLSNEYDNKKYNHVVLMVLFGVFSLVLFTSSLTTEIYQVSEESTQLSIGTVIIAFCICLYCWFFTIRFILKDRERKKLLESTK